MHAKEKNYISCQDCGIVQTLPVSLLIKTYCINSFICLTMDNQRNNYLHIDIHSGRFRLKQFAAIS